MIFVLSVLIASVFAQTEIAVGSALVMSLFTGADVDICPVKVVIPASRAGDKCVLEIRAVLTGNTAAGGLDLAFYWKKDSAVFAESDKLASLPMTNIENKVDCKTAGTYYIGVKVTKCTVCTDVLKIPASFDLDVAFRIDGVYQLDFDGQTNRQSAWLNSKANDYVYVNFGVTSKSTPHFNIDKCITCATDNYDYFYGPQGTDFSNVTNRIAVTGDAANLVKLPMIDPGNYTFGVFIKTVTAGTNSQFRFQYSLNEKKDTKYPDAVCPKAKCATVYNCPECSRNSCNWCEATRTCSSGGCGANDTAVNVEASCFDIGKACLAIKDCNECANRLGCVWCNSLGGVGIDVGSCSAGKYDNGMECTSPLATAISEAAKCPGGAKPTVRVNGTDGTLKPSAAAGLNPLSLLAAVAIAFALIVVA